MGMDLCRSFMCGNDAEKGNNLCRDCTAKLVRREGPTQAAVREALAADRARIAKAIREEFDGFEHMVIRIDRLLGIVEGGFIKG